jgi:hypothetical protein
MPPASNIFIIIDVPERGNPETMVMTSWSFVLGPGEDLKADRSLAKKPEFLDIAVFSP